MKKHTLVKIGAVFAFVFVIFLTGYGCGRGDAVQVTIIHTNDLHGHILPERVANWPMPMGGYAVFASWVREARAADRAKGIPLLLLDGGDIFAGTPEGDLTKGMAVVELMNAVGYDAMAVGNHEFDAGYFNLMQLAKKAAFPFLGANVSWKSTGRNPDFIRPFIIKEAAGIKIGIVGVVTEETAAISLPRNVDQVVFRPPVPSVRFYQGLVRKEGADFLIVLSHLGLAEDRKLAREVSGIDLIIGGHSHDLLPKPLREGKTLICQAGSYGRYAGRLDLWIDPKTQSVLDYRYQIFTNLGMSHPKDLEVDRFLDRIREQIGKGYDRKIGLAVSDIRSDDEKESLLGDMVADAIREKTGAQVTFQNAYGIRWPLLRGDITYRDVFKVVPFDDQIVTMKLSGKQIKEVLEQSLTLKKGMLQVSGLTATYNLDEPEGKRLLSLMIGNYPVSDQAIYAVSTNGFLAAGGDHFSTFTQGAEVRETGVLLRDALAEYIMKHSPLCREGFTPQRLLPARR